MINIGIAICIAAFTGLEHMAHWLPDSPPITILILFLHLLEFALVYSSLYSEIERCNIIHDRVSKARNRYANFHQLSHSKQTLVSVGIYFLMAKAILYTQHACVKAAFQPLAILLPLYFIFPLNKRYAFLKMTAKNELSEINAKFMTAYAVYVLLVIILENFSLPWVLILLTPFIKVYFGEIESIITWLTSAYCISFSQPFLLNALPLLSLLIFTRYIVGSQHIYGKDAVKTYLQILIVNSLPLIWCLCFQSYSYGVLIQNLRSLTFAAIFHNCLLYLGLKLAKIGSRNRPMSHPQSYFIQSFRQYVPKNVANNFGDGRFDKIQEAVGATIILIINLSFPASFWTFVLTAHILFWTNRVLWNRYIVALRIVILILRDMFKINYSKISNSLLRCIAIFLNSFGKTGFTQDPSNLNLYLTGLPYTELDPYTETFKHQIFQYRHYSMIQILSLSFAMLITAGLLLVPRKGKRIENILLMGYPITWIAIYQTLNNLDSLQLQIYGYMSADVLMLFFK